MKVAEIRNSFLTYFEQKGHTIVPSSSLIPAHDKSLLFTNAGMVQFKETFLGSEHRPYRKAVSAQCCVRAGGKHNDLENVGYTARHHTFFEMLGNFSFGDYFKREAIYYAWEYLTQVLKLSPQKLWITVYHEDEEAAEIWLNEIKIDPLRFSRCGAKDNFWAMAETGPCGPCSEIFYDHGPHVKGGPPGSAEAEGDRYIEIWNLVFMQYNRENNGELKPLPQPSIDTGMGLERLAAVLQGVTSNYHIDLFAYLIKAAAELLQVTHLEQKSLRVLADHIRSTAFLIADGVIPSNEGRGYVLRRIIRRALRHGHQLGAKQAFFYQLVEPLVQEMGEAYPHLQEQKAHIQQLILKEEEQFARTLEQGLRLFTQAIQKQDRLISGETLFKLYDTYGFPIDLTADIAREKGLEVDIKGFEQAMEAQRARARAFSQFAHKAPMLTAQSEFVGYNTLSHSSPIVGLLKDQQLVETLIAPDQGWVILNQTPFYAQSGGQVGDKGILRSTEGEFIVEDTQKMGEAIVHVGWMKSGKLALQQTLDATVDSELRQATRLNHSATHLLHAALREIIGLHVIQKGSLVEPSRLRFDFSHFAPLSCEQIHAIEMRVNQKILENSEAKVTVMRPEQAIKKGAIALFGEKYGEAVRVLEMGAGFSVELCGGTHVTRTGDIGLFKIISEVAIAAGIRRIEALTGKAALDWLSSAEETVNQLAHILKIPRQGVGDKVNQLLVKIQVLEKESQHLKAQLAAQVGNDLASEAQSLGGVKLLVKKLDGDLKMMRTLVDDLKNKLGTAIIVLGCVTQDKVQLIVGVTKNCLDRFSAGELANFIGQQLGGKGGGRPDLAQAGGRAQGLEQALFSVEGWVREKL